MFASSSPFLLLLVLVAAGFLCLRVDCVAQAAASFGANTQARVICGEQTIGIEFSNADGLEGRVYARRMAADPNCVRHFSASNRIVRFEIPFNFHSCGIKSRRMTHPRPGLEYSLTTIISKGHAHMTEDDRMFALSCRYYSNHRDVGTVMEVSTYSKSYLVGGRNGPACSYSLRSGSLNGPTAENARIGDKVFHEWRCADSSFALKVYECYVHDGHNRKYRLVDERGCSIDKTIVPEIVYDPSLNFAFAPSRVFKFAESHRMFFNCLLMMCPKSDPSCRMAVPPNCSKRERRAAANGTNTRTLDAIYSVNATLPFELSGESTRSLERSREQADELLAQAEAEVAAERAEKKAAEEKEANTKHEKHKQEKADAVEPPASMPILSAPLIEFQTVTSAPCPPDDSARSSVKTTLVALIVSNLLTLFVATIAIAFLCKRHHSASFRVFPSVVGQF